MVFSCCVPGCRSESYPGCSVSFHGFPKDEETRQAWLGVIWVKGSTNHKKVCSKHFKITDFLIRGMRKFLKADAVPSLLLTLTPEKKLNILSNIQLKPTNTGISEELEPSIQLKPTNTGISEELELEPSTSKQFSKATKRPLSEIDTNEEEPKKKICVEHKCIQTKKGKENVEKQRKIKILNQRLKRRDARINSLKSLLQIVKKRTANYEDLETILKQNHANIHTEFHHKDKKNIFSTGARYSPEIKQFALTLQYYSPRAYRFLRKHIHLPHPATLRRMLSSVDCNVGFISEVFDFLKKNVSANKDLANVALIFDSMSIKSELVYDKNSDKTWGYVDMGGIENVDCIEIAKEALIFEIVSYSSRFKCCIGYFLVNKITATIQAQLVSTAIKMLHDINITVNSITCDGTASNIKTLEKLGCSFDITNMKTNFKHPNGETAVHCILDPPHMLKLARNTLADFLLKSDKGIISYEYIKLLHDIQESEGIRFANKLTGNHVNFWGKKMNVRLASQLISNSVADSIDFLRVSGNEQFKDSEATVEFIRVLDKAFDVMNSKNPRGTGLKAPITLENKSFWENVFSELRKFLINLTIDEQSAMEHRRKTFALGFYANTISFTNLAVDLLTKKENPLKYFLGYKCSQDHVEMLFSCIRARGGGNDNPNALQLRYILRKLLFKNYITPSPNANAYDDEFEITPILQFRSYRRRNTLNTEDLHEYENEIETLISLIGNSSLSLYQSNILYYITGCIVKILHNNITCAECRSLIRSRNNNFDHSYTVDIKCPSAFTAFVNRGALFFPSQAVFEIVKFTEKIFKQIDVDSIRMNYKRRILQTIMYHYSNKISMIFPHSLSQGIQTEDLHEIQLLKAIVIKFLDMRLKHHERSKSLRYQGSKSTTRQRLHKSILFSNL